MLDYVFKFKWNKKNVHIFSNIIWTDDDGAGMRMIMMTKASQHTHNRKKESKIQNSKKKKNDTIPMAKNKDS